MVTIEEIIELGGQTRDARDSNRIEVSQAQSAIAHAFVQTDEANAATFNEEVDRADAQAKIAALDANSTPEDVRAAVDSFNKFLGSHDIRLVEVSEAVESASKAVAEQAEADATKANYTGLADQLKEKCAAYTLED